MISQWLNMNECITNDFVIFALLVVVLLWIGIFLCLCEVIRLLRKVKCIFLDDNFKCAVESKSHNIMDDGDFQDEYEECWKGDPPPDKRISTLGGQK